ncbi:transcription factor bHLH91-like [Selaginella moellendorffii]|uniref:transcription factor bHLH91-like n=1 Tax=Selaginella moellendorffii TaxID=88036 RepID=UPI000D1C682C|nr:transcription factor bHLH91-like [Selaginella moellendorffii]|eukprot:XP_024536074.1 transcription factor bHLH91-like [Selaginella moellendorffii]
MQHFGATTLYEDHNYFARSSEAFTLEGGLGSDTGAGLLDLTDTLEKQLEASNLALSDAPQLSSELNVPSTEFELDDHGQLLHDMLQQQQPATSNTVTSSTTTAATWEENVHVLQEMLMQQQHIQVQQQQQNFFGNSTPPKFRRESELLSLLQLPRCASGGTISGPFSSVISKKLSHPAVSSFTAAEIGGDSSHLHGQQMLPQPSFRHLLHTLPHPPDHPSSKPGIMRPPGLLDYEDRDNSAGHEERRLFPSLIEKRDFTFAKGAESRGINHFATERQRREYLNEKYQTLRSLVPNPSKADRASIVADAIDYVKELKRTVQELQLLVEEKRRGSNKRCKASPDDPSATDVESTTVMQQPGGTRVSKETTFLGDGSQLRSSWLQRTSQMGTHIDVRIVDDEVNIKLTQRRRRNYVLLAVLKSLDELRLDLLHANGASIGEHHIFMFNTKIMEGTATFAGQVAAKLIDAVDRHITLASSSY